MTHLIDYRTIASGINSCTSSWGVGNRGKNVAWGVSPPENWVWFHLFQNTHLCDSRRQKPERFKINSGETRDVLWAAEPERDGVRLTVLSVPCLFLYLFISPVCCCASLGQSVRTFQKEVRARGLCETCDWLFLSSFVLGGLDMCFLFIFLNS